VIDIKIQKAILMNLPPGDMRMQTPASREEPKLLDQVRDLIRLKHYSIRTEQAYLGWIRRFILFHHRDKISGLTLFS
jgi:hypothetical protein